MTKFNGKYLGGQFMGIRQDGNKTDRDKNPVMVLLLKCDEIKEVLGLEQVSEQIHKIRVPQFLIQSGTLHDFADYVNEFILIPYTEKSWKLEDKELTGVTLTLDKSYRKFLELHDLLNLKKPDDKQITPFNAQPKDTTKAAV